MEQKIERLRKSAKTFRENPVYTQDGDRVFLTVQAGQLDWAADHIDALEARVAEAESKTSGVLEVKLIDQNGVEVGSKGRFYRDLLKEEAWRDEGGTIWTQPTAWAYAAVCQARDKHQARAEAAERALEEAVEVLRPFADLDHEEEAAASLLGARDGNAAVRVPRRHLRQARAFLTKRGEK